MKSFPCQVDQSVTKVTAFFRWRPGDAVARAVIDEDSCQSTWALINGSIGLDLASTCLSN